jgi:hypothetical protein
MGIETTRLVCFIFFLPFSQFDMILRNQCRRSECHDRFSASQNTLERLTCDEIARVRALFDQLAFTASQIELQKVHSEQKELCKSVPDLKR